jgi:tetratricopeptide (TPR) repeat protein
VLTDTLVRCRPHALGLSLIVAIATGGCALHRPFRSAADAQASRGAEQDSFETAISKIRKLQTMAKPATERGLTIESEPGAVRDALAAANLSPTGPNLRRVAEAYRQVGVLDVAYAYYSRALKIDDRDAAAYEGLARIWRDWGFPHLGMGDAHRATYFAPRSAAAYNTLGTLLQAVGNTKGARSAFERALVLEPKAAYALNNVCYLSFLAGDSASAISACRRALEIDPTLVPAQNNLALAFASTGDFEATAAQFAKTGDPAAREFNLGIVLSAVGRYADAERSFQAASALRPDWKLAEDRARQAGRVADDAARRTFLERGTR